MNDEEKNRLGHVQKRLQKSAISVKSKKHAFIFLFT